MADKRLKLLRKVLDYFESWEEDCKKRKQASKELMSAQCREDLASLILGTIMLCDHHIEANSQVIVPARLNSDIVENTYVIY